MILLYSIKSFQGARFSIPDLRYYIETSGTFSESPLDSWLSLRVIYACIYDELLNMLWLMTPMGCIDPWNDQVLYWYRFSFTMDRWTSLWALHSLRDTCRWVGREGGREGEREGRRERGREGVQKVSKRRKKGKKLCFWTKLPRWLEKYVVCVCIKFRV